MSFPESTFSALTTLGILLGLNFDLTEISLVLSDF
jgi:hypothetical protein